MKPGETLGILGGGQLGRLIALAAKQLGLRSVVLDPSFDCPAAQAADKVYQAGVDDTASAALLAAEADVVTLEWELIPLAVLRKVESLRPLYPGSVELSILQDRLTQKQFLERKGFAQAPFRRVDDMGQLKAAAQELGLPGILKRRKAGYDGKGQIRLESEADLARAEEVLKAPCVLEGLVRFEKEISIVLARDRDGRCADFPLAENIHEKGILMTTLAPARVTDETARQAALIGRRLAEFLQHVGVMAVELFVLPDGSLFVNEIAPRVHNSGHYTREACATSQFEQHVRAVAGLPLGSTLQKTPAVMINLLGDLWDKGEPDWKILEEPGVTLTLYGKKKASKGRKMGHYTVTDDNIERALARADALLRKLTGADA